MTAEGRMLTSTYLLYVGLFAALAVWPVEANVRSLIVVLGLAALVAAHWNAVSLGRRDTPFVGLAIGWTVKLAVCVTNEGTRIGIGEPPMILEWIDVALLMTLLLIVALSLALRRPVFAYRTTGWFSPALGGIAFGVLAWIAVQVGRAALDSWR